jgi:metal-responsive CopG/Arc/MetJ family transcriptional regulator
VDTLAPRKIQVVIDSELLKAADRVAKTSKLSRSALIRNALGEHIKNLRHLDLLERERQGYLAQPQREDEFLPWEKIIEWPEP